LHEKDKRIRILEDQVESLALNSKNLKDALKKLDGDKQTWEIDLETLYQLEEEQKKNKQCMLT
jgi:prefoldin subunit 5